MSTKMTRIRRDELPTISSERLVELATTDRPIDLSDIPEWGETEFSKAVHGQFYRPLKSQITAKLDKDVLAWLKASGPGYQTRMNAILRAAMLSATGAD
jgi:uncharacterized protein (DUF4415 family)